MSGEMDIKARLRANIATPPEVTCSGDAMRELAIDALEAIDTLEKRSAYISDTYDAYTEKYGAYTTEITPQFVADIRHLVSIAVWIRSEQLVQRDVQRLVRTVDPSEWKTVAMPLTFIDTRQLTLDDCVKDQKNGIEWWNRLNSMLELMGQKTLAATWGHT